MFRKFIGQNKTLILASLVLLLIFISVLYVGIDQIYKRESARQHEQEVAQLQAGKMTVKTFFDNIVSDLRLLSSFPAIENYVESEFKRSHDEVKELFLHFAESNYQFYRYKIIDSSGQARIVVDNKPQAAPEVLPYEEWHGKKPRDYLAELLELEKDQIHSSPINFQVEFGDEEVLDAPVLWVSIPLTGAGGKIGGIFSLAVNISECLRLLPESILVQTEEDNLIFTDHDGVVEFHQSGYAFPEHSGDLFVSDMETIHYTTKEFLPGKSLILGIHHKHPELKQIFNRMVAATVMLGALFFGMVFVIDYVNFQKNREMVSAEKAIIFSLASLAEGRDPETGAHLARTKTYSALLAGELAEDHKFHKIISRDFIENLSEATPLHDIGKVAIPDSILLKAEKLTDDEFEKIKEHVSAGKKIVGNAIDKFKLKQPFLAMSLNICEYHHEKYSGEGYWGLKGEQIPLEARIFALCDAYDAIRSERPYKRALPHDKAVERIKKDSGTHFDPDVVNAFLRCEEDFKDIRR